jgi:hypothetical protein
MRDTGSFDRYEELTPLAKRHSAWVHVDGAFGLWAAASSNYSHLLKGFEEADSWATDGHKWLNVPFDSGYGFVARPLAHGAAMSHRASYLMYDDDGRDQIDWNPEWSRRGRGFATYAAIRELGRQGIDHLVNRCCQCSQILTDGIASLTDVDLLWRPILNQGLVRFRHPNSRAEQDHDAYTDIVIQRILSNGSAFFMGTTWRGRRAMRISVLNWQTTEGTWKGRYKQSPTLSNVGLSGSRRIGEVNFTNQSRVVGKGLGIPAISSRQLGRETRKPWTRCRPERGHLPLRLSRQAIASSSTRIASATGITGRAWNSKAGSIEQNL